SAGVTLGRRRWTVAGITLHTGNAAAAGKQAEFLFFFSFLFGVPPVEFGLTDFDGDRNCIFRRLDRVEVLLTAAGGHLANRFGGCAAKRDGLLGVRHNLF